MIESESVECNAVSNDGNEHDNAATVSALRAANADLQVFDIRLGINEMGSDCDCDFCRVN